MDARMNVLPGAVLKRLALQAVKVGVIPHQEIDVQVRLFVAEPHDLVPEALQPPRMLRKRGAWDTQARVDLPAGKDGDSGGLLEQLTHAFEVLAGLPDLLP